MPDLATGLLAVELWPLALGLAAYRAEHRKGRSEAWLQRRVIARFATEHERRERLLAGLLGRLRRQLAELVQ